MSELSKLTDLDEAANNAYQKIRENEEKVLNLSKEDTLLGYEKQSIITKFGTFENFIDHNNSLYRDYIADLIENPTKDVKANVGLDKAGTDGDKPAWY